ncbi:MAG: aminoglycoside phosphotransferase family protein [Chloroflexi bacterium]|nr:aminoglycoside phosphotransferase family protein [Chloroflexota bacterium]MCI0646320.1 aminoglycoside phosphotransferase family protein [Chloroflexota bacterium]MCI0726982.1 aminoglycoside phosphotransferase family protein [Chloroflexota bacterium]
MDDRRTDYLPAFDAWPEWGAAFTNVTLWRPLLAHLYQQAGLGELGAVEAGFPGSCAVFIVDRQVVIKLFPPFLPQDYERELDVYHLLDGRLEPYLPRLLAHGVYHDRVDYPYLALEFCPGQPIREVRQELSQSDKTIIAREVGWMIRTVHETPLDGVKAFDPRPAAWLAFLEQRRRDYLDELRHKASLPERVLEEVAGLLAVGPNLPADFRPRLLNADLTEDHLLLVRRLGEWRISALIDWADALVGAAEYEWVALWFGLCGQDPALFREIMQAYDPAFSLDRRFRRQMLAYTFLHRFGPAIVGELLGQPGAPSIHSLADLQSWLWPPELE